MDSHWSFRNVIHRATFRDGVVGYNQIGNHTDDSVILNVQAAGWMDVQASMSNMTF